ncbi:hypothetical protein RJ55_04400 [Drechmeria coniospora]|nr:hypothetical protein RJ55_04400 [Drechmeria coniospora]
MQVARCGIDAPHDLPRLWAESFLLVPHLACRALGTISTSSSTATFKSCLVHLDVVFSASAPWARSRVPRHGRVEASRHGLCLAPHDQVDEGRAPADGPWPWLEPRLDDEGWPVRFCPPGPAVSPSPSRRRSRYGLPRAPGVPVPERQAGTHARGRECAAPHLFPREHTRAIGPHLAVEHSLSNATMCSQTSGGTLSLVDWCQPSYWQCVRLRIPSPACSPSVRLAKKTCTVPLPDRMVLGRARRELSELSMLPVLQLRLLLWRMSALGTSLTLAPGASPDSRLVGRNVQMFTQQRRIGMLS